MTSSKISSSAVTKKPKAQTSKPAKAKNSSLSAELVGDSDDLDEKESIKPPGKDAKITKPKAIDSKTTAAAPNSLKPEHLKKRKSPSSAPTRNVASGGGTVKDSQEYTTTEDDKEGSPSSGGSTPSPVRPTTSAPARAAKPKSLKPAIPNGATSGKNLKPPHAHSNKEGTFENTSQEDSESSATSSNEDESENESACSAKNSLQSLGKASPARQSALKPAPLPYEPPPGFEPASISSQPSSRIFEILAPSDLAGKQIWHITVPASVPVTTIKQVSVQSIQTGGSILSYKGADYGLVPEAGAHASNRALLLPSSQTNDYQPSKIPILKTLRLQQLVKIPNLTQKPAGIPSLASKSQNHVKAERQQPQGLKMRYHAFGASDSSDSDVSATTAIKPSQFRVLDVPVRPTKERKFSDGVADSTQAFPTKSKKRKVRHETRLEVEDSAMDVDSPLDKEIAGSNRSSAASSQDVGATAVNGVEPSTVTKWKKDDKRHKDQKTPTASQSILPTDLRKEAETLIPQEVVNIDAGINRTASEKDANAAKAQRKAEKRKRKEMVKPVPTKAVELPLANLNGRTQQESRRQSQEHSVHLH